MIFHFKCSLLALRVWQNFYACFPPRIPEQCSSYRDSLWPNRHFLGHLIWWLIKPGEKMKLCQWSIWKINVRKQHLQKNQKYIVKMSLNRKSYSKYTEGVVPASETLVSELIYKCLIYSTKTSYFSSILAEWIVSFVLKGVWGYYYTRYTDNYSFWRSLLRVNSFNCPLKKYVSLNSWFVLSFCVTRGFPDNHLVGVRSGCSASQLLSLRLTLCRYLIFYFLQFVPSLSTTFQ